MKQLPLFTIILIAMSQPVAAHPVAPAASDFLSGMAHPLSGLDHMLAMITLGFWAGALGGRAVWRLPQTFLSAMVLGVVLAELKFNIPVSEAMTVASTGLISVLALLRLELPNVFFLTLVSLLAVVHGYAHAVDLSMRTSFLSFGAGFLAATAVLLLGGILLAYLTSRTEVRAPRTTS